MNPAKLTEEQSAVAKTAKKKKTVRKKAAGKSPKNNGRKKTLVIVESPAKAKTINRYLGNNYVIEASMGHIIDLPKSRIAVDVEHGFKPEYITVRGRAPILNRLKKLAGAAEQVLLAADPDREGEAISYHLANALRDKNPIIGRIEFNEITKTAVKEAIKNPREIDLNRVNAQQARRILDRLVGYNISPLLWKKIKRGLSAGRVQSIANRFICEREKEIEVFVPEEYWTLDVKLQSDARKALTASLHSINGEKARLKTQEQVETILRELEQQEFAISGITRRERRRQPSAPYTTSKMQQDAANKLGYTSQKTMMVAQQLYEGVELDDGTLTGLITYMRTDSTRVAPTAIDTVREYIGGSPHLGAEYLSTEVRIYKSGKQAQDAHEAIRPTDPNRTPEAIQKNLSRDQFRLYQLVWQKFVSSQMADEIADHTSIDIQAGSYLFRATGRLVKFPGYTAVFNQEEKKKKEAILPELTEGEILQLKKMIHEQHFTQPPPRFTDASMVKTLEECGVGRPSTYAPTIQTLLKRFYVVRVQKSLKPTELGSLVNSVMVAHFPELVDTEFTARMEDELDQIANSSLDWVEMLRRFYSPFTKTLENAAENIAEMRNILDEETDYVCEKCGRKLVKKIGRNGYFLACPGFPECRNARAIPLGKCPVCEDGEVIQRATKRGRPFYGCSRYPDCDFSTWDRPLEDEYCPECGKILLEKSSREKGKYIGCSVCSYETAAQTA